MAEEPEPTFEDALARIERIVDDLEQGEPSLSAALTRYEDGVKLLRRCYDLLDQAERSVALLTGVDDDGRPTTAAFDATATQAREPDPVTAPSAGIGAPPAAPRRRSRSATPSPPSSDPEATDVPF